MPATAVRRGGGVEVCNLPGETGQNEAWTMPCVQPGPYLVGGLQVCGHRMPSG